MILFISVVAASLSIWKAFQTDDRNKLYLSFVLAAMSTFLCAHATYAVVSMYHSNASIDGVNVFSMLCWGFVGYMNCRDLFRLSKSDKEEGEKP